ncbi:MAG: N-acetylmuramoyl-L-alanine amidase [Bacteroidetes bacterium]|nr:N-acetylmuramoyl-L-alanine amidase [Bacteroidota bacterium]
MKTQNRRRKSVLEEVYKDNRKLLGHDTASPKNRRKLIMVILLLVIGSVAAFYFGMDEVSSPNPTLSSDLPPSEAEQTLRASLEHMSSLEPNQEDPSLSQIYGLNVRTIAIDPGHGGRDPGAVGPAGMYEKTLTLDLALRLERRLKAKGINVLLTRREDKTLSLRERVDFTKNNQVDLFLSLHFNALPIDTVAFIETFYFSPQGDERAQSLAAQENIGSDYSIGEWQNILDEAGQTLRIEESRKLATHIQHAMVSQMRDVNHALADWGARPGPFMVLMSSSVPAILAEVTAISMPEEEQRLIEVDYREMLAHGLEIGILTYLSES